MSVPSETWGPTVSGGRRRRGRRGLAVVLVLLLLLPVVYGVAVGLVANANITRVPVTGLQESSGPMHVLVVGSDSREGMTEEERRELTTGSAEGARTDTIMVLSISGGKVGMLAFPRDLYVTRCDGSTGRINVATQIDGPGCLVETVSDLSGLSISAFVSVSFLGFRDIVEAVGGVEMCLDRPISDASAGIDLPAGCQTLDGREALGFVRVRKIDNDLERIKRQQAFLRALAGTILAPETLVNPVRTVRTAAEIGSALTADEGLGPIDLAKLGFGLRGLAAGSAVTATVPATPATRGGAAVLVPDPAAEELFASFRDGSALGSGAGAGPVDRADVTVSVLNGAGVEGAASRTAEELRTVGWAVGEVGNTEIGDTTRILHPPDLRTAAEQLRRDLPFGAELVEDDSGSGLTLVLGSDLADSGA
ncbi:MAG: LCP family protein [Actinobacteria bacterium]|nr:LCP family protein [Actinomycetota bacterium]